MVEIEEIEKLPLFFFMKEAMRRFPHISARRAVSMGFDAEERYMEMRDAEYQAFAIGGE